MFYCLSRAVVKLEKQVSAEIRALYVSWHFPESARLGIRGCLALAHIQ